VSDPEFERRLSAALHAPSAPHAGARGAIMARVRALPLAARPRRRTRPAARGARHSLAGLLLAAGIGSIGTMASLRQALPTDGGPGVMIVGDSVSATLRDTLRLVRLMFDDAEARRVAAVGDFNGWHADSTPLARVGTSHRWTATVALRDGAHRYAFVVDGARWAIDPAAPHLRGDDGRVVSLLHVARRSN